LAPKRAFPTPSIPIAPAVPQLERFSRFVLLRGEMSGELDALDAALLTPLVCAPLPLNPPIMPFRLLYAWLAWGIGMDIGMPIDFSGGATPCAVNSRFSAVSMSTETMLSSIEMWTS
jgi:hypothetical protein